MNKKEIFNRVPKLKIDQKKFYLNISENYSGISEFKIDFTSPSPYRQCFFNGATIFPRPYFYIEIDNEEKYAYKISTSKKYTTNKNKRRSKGDYRFSFENFIALKDLVYNVVMGEGIGNFSYKTEHVILPILNGNFIFEQVKNNNG
ncbi:MAG: hypothetical protein ACP5OE_10230, partial [Thermodesulfobium sp.]